MALTGMDDRPVYAKATDVGIIEETPEGSRFLVQGQWAYVTESPSLLIEAVQTAGEGGLRRACGSGFVHLHGALQTTSAGTLQIRWAQNVSNISAATVLRGSFLRVVSN